MESGNNNEVSWRRLHFYLHPCFRITERLKEKIPCSIGELSQQISKHNLADKYRSYDNVVKMFTSDGKVYARHTGCAPKMIDLIAEFMGIAPCNIYAPEIRDVRQFVLARMKWVIAEPWILNDKEKVWIKEKKGDLNDRNLLITASWLKNVAEGTSLPPFYFFANYEEWESYREFRKTALAYFEEIVNLNLCQEFFDELRNLIRVKYKDLLRKEQYAPDDYISELYIKVQQQVTDGNTNFLNYRHPFKSYLKRVLLSVLKDHCKKNRLIETPISQIMRESSHWDFPDKPLKPSKEHKNVREVLVETIRRIPSEKDRCCQHRSCWRMGRCQR